MVTLARNHRPPGCSQGRNVFNTLPILLSPCVRASRPAWPRRVLKIIMLESEAKKSISCSQNQLSGSTNRKQQLTSIISIIHARDFKGTIFILGSVLNHKNRQLHSFVSETNKLPERLAKEHTPLRIVQCSLLLLFWGTLWPGNIVEGAPSNILN